MTTTLQTTTITFPEIKLQRRDAHKLRGYFGRLFQEHSELLHNHFENGGLKYGYSMIQYKIVDNVPMLMGFGEGARLLTQLFLDIHELNIDGRIYPVFAKNIEARTWHIGLSNRLTTYHFDSLWMALNERNHDLYKTYEPEQQLDQLRGIAVQNILAFFTAFDLRLPENQRVMLELVDIKEHQTTFKNTQMKAFAGKLVTNATLPDLMGIGKSVSRGFGVLRRR